METTLHPNGIAPTEAGSYRLGAKGGKMVQAWQHIWDRLDTTNWAGSLELSQDAAEKFGLKPVSVSEMLCRMRAAGVLEQSKIEATTEYLRKRARRDDESDQEYEEVPLRTYVANRKRVHYRIARRATR